MKLELRNNKDFWSGVMLIVLGIGAVYIAGEYRLGSIRRMGPGFFPVALGWILTIFGVVIMAKGLITKEQITVPWSARALILLPLSMVLFGIVIEFVGFVPAIVVLVLCAAAAGSEFKLLEAVLLAAALVLLSVSVFIWLIDLPYPLFKAFW
ncbi:MAG: tripartite tricarboxylate transporter TctB family protein [Syntrophaceae bacterium]|nr:tripartite tricarboxylate transporter TctB family protein [Syntrophaceae bacterium]